MLKGTSVIGWLRGIVRGCSHFDAARGGLLFRIPIITFLLLSFASTAHAQSVTDVAEWGKRIQSGHSIGALGTDLFGDSTSYYDGSTSFSVTDIDLPGNNALPVRIGRTLAAEDAEGLEVGGLMADWNLDIPYISGVFTYTYGWKTNGSNPYARCSNTGSSYSAVYLNDSQGITWDYWRGNSLYIPGHGKHSLLQRYAGPAMADGQTTNIGTQDFSQVRCLPSLANPGSVTGASGEAFLVTDSGGTQYTFNWMAARPFSTLVRGPLSGQRQLKRIEVRLYPTQVKDRFGNTVTYTWSGTQLTSIVSSDGRTITLTYDTNGRIATATANGRSWRYSYGGGQIGSLSGVQLPDGTSWSISAPQLTILFDSTKPQPIACDQLGIWQSDLARTFVFKHPSGATGSFTFSPMRHGRTKVPYRCQNEPDSGGYVEYGPPILRDNFALTQKQITGPGLSTLTWSAGFSAAVGGYTTCGSSCPDTKTVTVTNPDGSYTVYTYGIRYYIDEGKLLRRQIYSSGGALVRDESTSYALNPVSPPYAKVVGNDYTLNPDNFGDSYLVPRTQTTLLQDGDTYTNTVNSFDNFARSLSVTRANSFGGSRTDVKAYYDDLQHWVVGQTKSSTNSNTGVVESATDYDPATALPATTYRFGLAQLRFTYNADGTMATIKDGLNRTATLSNWKRGAPQNALFPDNSTKSAVIDDNGWVTSTTDARGNLTSYNYDSMGRNTTIRYPTSPGESWLQPQITYPVLTAPVLGIPAGSWSARTVLSPRWTTTYYDALWRPVLTEDKDTNTGTVRYTKTSYDYEGRVVFKSYPSTASNPTSGINSTYDALGRMTQKANTDGTVLQTTSYLSGSRQQVTDASYNVTTTTYQAFDAPSGSNPVLVNAPGQTTTINRNVFGEITSVQQSGAEGTLTDTYLYDSYHRLCKRIEPETGQTVISYDAASQIIWSATGQNGSASSCDYGSVPTSAQVVNGYDLMGRKNSVTYPDASGNLILGYDPDGHLASASNPTASWGYTWDARGLLTQEQAVVDGQTFTLTPTYNNLANLRQRTYPDGTVITYNPDAWGRPTQLGSYATGIHYYPDNQPSSYTLGNGLSYSQTLDSWLRPQNVAVKNGATPLQSLTYGYNSDNDLTSIGDGVDGVDSASFQYDGLHRLTQATDGNLWGTYNYSYDAFNNIRTRKLNNAANLSYSYNSATNQLSTVSGVASRGYTYDSRGRITADGVRGYTWNLADEITAIPGVASYAYDAHGNRIKTTLQNGTVEYALYDLAGTLFYTSKSGVATDYLDLNGQVVAEVANGTPTYLHDDLLGSPRMATTSTNAQAWREHYDPYGVKLNGVANKVGYTGHAYDAESGLTYMKARIYDAQVGRFLSGDPIAFTGSPFSFNRYAYGNDNPYRYTDPTGGVADSATGDRGDCTGSRLCDSGSNAGKTIYGAAHGAPSGNSSGQKPIMVAQAPPEEVPEEARPENSASETEGPDESSPEAQQREAKKQEQFNKQQDINDQGILLYRTSHGEQRAKEAETDPDRQVGDKNRVLREGRQYFDNATGNNVFVLGNRVVITTPEGELLSQFTNTRANTFDRISSGRWSPK